MPRSSARTTIPLLYLLRREAGRCRRHQQPRRRRADRKLRHGVYAGFNDTVVNTGTIASDRGAAGNALVFGGGIGLLITSIRVPRRSAQSAAVAALSR